MIRIGEFAKKLGIETSVIRFWEKEFEVEAQRSHGQQRFYTEKDVALFSQIKELLYNKKYTIAGAKEELKQAKPCKKKEQTELIKIIPSTLEKEILELQHKLIKLRELL